MEDREKRTMPRLLSVNVGLPRDVAWQRKTVHTGIWKTPVQGRRMMRRLNIDGDGQGDLAGHGGEHRAVTARHVRETSWLSILTLLDAWICRRSRNLGSRAMPISIYAARLPS
jgi:hypothetical protein